MDPIGARLPRALRGRARMRLLAALAALVAAACGPFLVVPGGELDGKPASPPESWAFTDDVGTVQLETRPADPYSVNIWAVGMGDALYVHAGANRATWVGYLEEDPNVRVRVEDELYDLRADRVVDEAEFAAFADAYEEKYSTRPRNENVGEVYVFRLTAR